VEALVAEQDAQSHDHARLAEISAELEKISAELATREGEWLEVTLALES
jgi:ATP-binding cassette subfamily F protein uup